jgi:hypothetical protein
MVRELTEGMTVKGGRNQGPSQITERPEPPAPMVVPREQFEQARDRENEREVVECVCKSWGCSKAYKLPRAYGLDYALLCGHELHSFDEIKCRDLTFGYGDGYYIALQKVMRAQQMTQASHVQSLLAVRFRDGVIRWAPLCPRRPVKFFGRNNPRDAEDYEPCAIIPWSAFYPLDALQRIDP